MESSLIKRGTKITPNLIQSVFINTYHNVNQIPFSNIAISTKQFSNLQGCNNDSVVDGKTKDFLEIYCNYVINVDRM